MTRIFLNELRTDDRRLAIPEPGKWKADPSFLQKFSHDIYVKGQVGDRIVNSVPSVFARPIQFYQALSEESHPMHRTVVGQWRGLLAMFALQRALQIPLRVTRFSLREETQPADLDRQFTNILNAQLPYPPEEWKSWLLIYCDDQLVGATSPWTIIYTPSAYKVRSGISWTDSDGLLTDPFQTLYDASSTNDELRVLLAWLDVVIAQHPWGMAPHHEEKSGVIARELATWRSELGRFVQPYPGVVAVDRPFGQAIGVYAYFLATAPVPPITDTAVSGLQLADDDGCDAIILSRSALTNPKWAKQRVYGGVRVEHLDLSTAALPKAIGDAGWRTRTGIAVAKPYIIAEEYFLSQRLLALPLSDAARSAGSSEYALPLTPAFFKHFSVARLNDGMLSVEESTDGISVRLRLPLKNGGTVDVERQYRGSEIEHIPEGQHIPALAVWPDFYDPDWGDYEALLVDNGPHSPRIRFAPLLSTGQTSHSVALSQEDGAIAVWREQNAVLGFAAEVSEPGRAALSAGVVLRRTVTVPRNTGAAWNVGIDFGTSNTQIKVRDSESERSLPIQQRLLLLTRPTRSTVDRLGELYAPQTVVPPFPTALARELVLLVSGASAAQETIGVIALAPDVTRLARGSQGFVRDLKWTADENTQKMYLQALARAICAEARAAGVAHLHLHWSYPLSLPERIRLTMESFWTSIGSQRSRPGFEVEGTMGASESDAVSRYVLAKDVLPIADDSLSVGIDVGGGSTDAAFWSGSTLIDRVSLNIAANDIIRIASAFESINRELLLAGGRQADATATSLEDWLQSAFVQRPEIIWNALLQLMERGRTGTTPHDHPFVTKMNMTNNEDWRKCRTAAYLALGGVCFYLGIQAGAHVGLTTSNVAIYLGGRGSSLFSWIAAPARLRELVSSQFQQGLKLSRPEAKPNIEVAGPVAGTSSRALLKDEVASGLVEPKELTAATKEGLDIKSTLIGEAHWADPSGNEVQWYDPMNTARLASLKPPSNHNSSFIAYFLNQVARPIADQLNLDSQGLASLQLSQNWAINDMRKKHDEYVLQPIFAYELKSLVRKYAENASART